MADEILTPAKALIQWDNLPAPWKSDLVGAAAQAVLAAIQRYGVLRTRTIYDTFVGDDTNCYDLSDQSIAEWDEDSSDVLRVDCPWTLAGGDNAELESDAWQIVYDSELGKHLLLNETTPGAADTVRIQFSAAWTEPTIPSRDLPAVAKLAAAGICRALAARRAQTGDNTINAGVSLGPSETDNWLRLARDYEKAFENEIGAKPNSEPQAAVASIQLTPIYDEDW
jgi:hypothetical protein